MLVPTTIVILLGTCVRLWLFRSSSLAHWLADRNEVATPLTSWKRMTEGLVLVRAGVSPYSGDVFHETPLMLKAVGFIESILGSDNMWFAFLVTDMLTVLVLGAVASRMKAYFLQRQEVEMQRYVYGVCPESSLECS
jgi:GPI-anchor transamidase subunit U